jgi:hypothetical protein
MTVARGEVLRLRHADGAASANEAIINDLTLISLHAPKLFSARTMRLYNCFVGNSTIQIVLEP